MWYNGSILLFQGNQQIVKDSRVQIDADNKSLIIHSVSIYDDQVYKCRVLPKKIFEDVILHVNSAPSNVEITQDESVINDGNIDVPSGQKGLQFECKYGRGRPQATIRWAKNVSLEILP